jgi:hypothetical protein
VKPPLTLGILVDIERAFYLSSFLEGDLVMTMTSPYRYVALVALMIVVIGCGPRVEPDDALGPSDALMAMSFEERMAIRARLTVIDSEAKAEAAETHDRYASREEAIAYETLVSELKSDKRAALIAEHGILESDLDYIVAEYLDSRNVHKPN